MSTSNEITRHEGTRDCACSTCWNHREGRKNRIRCGRAPKHVYWTVGDSPIQYDRLRDAKAAAAQQEQS